ncbi:AraC family transcriptional regulator [Pedobacter chinensis]|uniref:AraC family transcriptional regulator n=1 Tax=Pedobacter chinensis TaxID=2282421 RepID=A0A369Q126_9SPHI|nr:AraC family transcriptional regulator [Pedobacter chinensis]RDC58583.1 AraC family transcriptional regulator [Pedobacter chinensis]
MEVKLSEHATGKVVYTNTYPHNFDGKKDIDECEKEFIGETYQIRLKEKWFEGIHISITEIESVKDIDFLFELSQQNITFLYCLDGSLNYYCRNKLDHFLSIEKNQQSITVGQLNHVVFNSAGKTRYIYIQLTKPYYSKIANSEFKSDGSCNKKNIAPELALILQALLNHQHTGRVKRLFIEAKIFELIIFYINQKSGRDNFSLKKDDVDKIQLARQIVESNLQKPNSLIELSRKAGINDYKLKKGFKELTGCTVFGYLYKIRMEKAYHYLANEKKSVSEVSFLVGYKNAQHFITAFKKRYNILPGSLNKN